MCLPFFAAGVSDTCGACGFGACGLDACLQYPFCRRRSTTRDSAFRVHICNRCNRSSCRAIATIADVHWETFSHDLIYLSHAATCKSMRMSRMCEMLQYISLRRSLAATLQADETADAMPTNADKCTKPTAFTSHSAASSDNKEVCASLHYDYTYLYFIYGFFPAELHVKILSWFAE